MTKAITIICFFAIAVMAMTAMDNADASDARRFSNEDADWLEGLDDDFGDNEDQFINESSDVDDVILKYGQCGGIGYEGSSMCAPDYVCVFSHPWYAQCLPKGMQTSVSSKHKSKRLVDNADVPFEVTADNGNDDVAVVPAWEQCGGKGFDFGFSRDDNLPEVETPKLPCEEGYSCVIVSEWYYQCRPLSKSVGIKLWGQCGGENYKGPSKCIVGSICKYFDAWYSQCVPKEKEFA